MQINIYPQPCLLLEAEELLFCYVNKIPAHKLSGDSQYCIPTSEIEIMLKKACAILSDADDEKLIFYFQQHFISGNSSTPTCLARLLTFSFSDWSCSGADDAAQSILTNWNRISQNPFTFTDISSFLLSVAPWTDDKNPPFAGGLNKLHIPMQLKEKLLDTFTDFSSHISALTELLKPVADYLSQALSPWVEQAKPLLSAWDNRMHTLSPAEFILQTFHSSTQCDIPELEGTFIYLAPGWIQAGIDPEHGGLKMLIGVNVSVPNPDSNQLAQWEYHALRLLGSPIRMKMLLAMREKPMTSREMAKSLDLHLGSVSRDVKNMQEAHLLNIHFDDYHRSYGINYEALRTLGNHLLALCPEKEYKHKSKTTDIH